MASRKRTYYYPKNYRRRWNRFYKRVYFRNLGNRTMQAAKKFNYFTTKLTFDAVTGYRNHQVLEQNLLQTLAWFLNGATTETNTINFANLLRLNSQYTQYSGLYSHVKLLGVSISASLVTSQTNINKVSRMNWGFFYVTGGANLHDSENSKNVMFLPMTTDKHTTKYFKNWNREYFPADLSVAQTATNLIGVGALSFQNNLISNFIDIIDGAELPQWNCKININLKKNI